MELVVLLRSGGGRDVCVATDSLGSRSVIATHDTHNRRVRLAGFP